MWPKADEGLSAAAHLYHTSQCDRGMLQHDERLGRRAPKARGNVGIR